MLQLQRRSPVGSICVAAVASLALWALLASEQSGEIIAESSVVDYSGHHIVRFTVSSPEDVETLTGMLADIPELDLWQHSPKGHADVRISPKHMTKIQAAGLKHKVVHANVAELIDKEKTPVGSGFYHQYHKIPKLVKKWKALVRAHPKHAKLVVLGHSHQKKPLYGIQIARPGLPANAPEIFVQSGQHAREWIGPAATTYVAQQLLEQKSAASGLLQHAKVTLVPLVNPDGYEYTQKDRMWRKNRHGGKSQGGICVGVDTNRNWPYHWAHTMKGGRATEDRATMCSSTWEGHHANTEPETAAMVRYVSHRKKSIQAFLDVHSYSQEILPPGCNGFPLRKGEESKVMATATAVAQAMSHNGASYTTGNCAKIMYPCSGVAHDWAYGSAKIMHSLAIEVRPSDSNSEVGFLLSPKQIIPTGKELLAGVLALSSKAVPAFKFEADPVKAKADAAFLASKAEAVKMANSVEGKKEGLVVATNDRDDE